MRRWLVSAANAFEAMLDDYESWKENLSQKVDG